MIKTGAGAWEALAKATETTMIPIPDQRLGTHRWGMRFSDSDTETRYMSWRIADSIPLIRLAIYTGIASILSVPALFYFIDHGLLHAMLPVLCGIVLPAQIVGLLMLRFVQPGKWVFALISILILLPGAGIVWVCYWVFQDARLSILGAVLAALYAPFIRVPPMLSMLAILPFLGMADFFLWRDFQAGIIPDVSFWAGFLATAAALTTILIVCMVVENLSRLSYSREQIIENQRKALDHGHDLIRRYIPTSVAAQIIAGNENAISEPRRQRITILFSDIVGFTDIADRVEPEVITQVINEYMGAMSEILDAHQGTVNEFIGDGLMALFGAPEAMEPEAHARQAILSARAMQDGLPALNQQWRKLGLGEALKIRIGINTGMASVGSYGSQGRMTYTAIGLQTNIAARIQLHCEPGGILISEATCHLVDDVIDCEPKGEVECKGVHFPVKVFAPRVAND